MTNIHQRGWLDTSANIRETFQDDKLLRSLKTRNATVPITHADLTVDMASKWAYLVTHGAYKIAGGRLPDQHHVHAVTIGELIAPVLPDNYFLSTQEANKSIRNILLYYARTETQVNRGKTKITFITSHNQVVAEGGEDAMDLQRIDPMIQDDDFLDEHGAEFVEYLLNPTAVDLHLTPIDIFTTLYVSVAKRGNVTEDFLGKILRGLLDDLQYEARLSVDSISYVYRFYGGFITASNAKSVMDKWLEDIPEVALRVRLTLQQATNSGLTALVTCGRAMRKYPDFPWSKLNTLTGGELTNFQAAAVVVAGNQYYGFNKTLGVARSTMYNSIAYIAKELLVTLNGETSLRRYAGWIRAPKNAAVVKELLETYKQNYLERMNKGEASPEDVAITNDVMALLNNEAHANLYS